MRMPSTTEALRGAPKATCPASKTEGEDCHFFELTKEFIERSMNDTIQENR